MIYPKDDPNGDRVLDLRGYEQYSEGKRVIHPALADQAMQDIGLDYANDKDKIDYVIIPSNCIIIYETFKGFTNLKIVYNLNTCYKVGSYAFFGCSLLSNSNLSNCVYVDEYAFSGCNNLISVNLKKCEFIGTEAFSDCQALVEVNCPNTVFDSTSTNVESVFARCESLQKVRIKPGINIPYKCFYECQNLQTVYNLNKCEFVAAEAFYGCYSLSNSDLSNCKSIASKAFAGCSNVTFSNLKKCTSIEEKAFYQCSSLENLDISNAELYDYSDDTGIFEGCYNLHSVKIKPQTIPSYAFKECYNLEIVYGLNKTGTIMPYAFVYCSKLSNKDFSKVEYFGQSCLYGCNIKGAKINKNAAIAGDFQYGGSPFKLSTLDKIEVGNNSYGFEEYALAECWDLEYIKIPKGMEVPDCYFRLMDKEGTTVNRTIYNFKYISSLGDSNLTNAFLTHNTILIDDPDKINPSAFVCCPMTEWNLPNITTEQVVKRIYFSANSGFTFHCKNGDVTVP